MGGVQKLLVDSYGGPGMRIGMHTKLQEYLKETLLPWRNTVPERPPSAFTSILGRLNSVVQIESLGRIRKASASQCRSPTA